MAEEVDPAELEIADESIAERNAKMPGDLPEDMPPLHRKICTIVDWISMWTGRIVCWGLIPLMFAMTYEIIFRKFFVAPTIWAFELSSMLAGGMFMLGAAYALSRGVHIRADFLYRTLPVRSQGMVDLALYLIFFFPGMILLAYYSYFFAEKAWMRGEVSMMSAWGPYTAPIKSTITIGAALLVIQGISEVLKCWYAIKKGVWP